MSIDTDLVHISTSPVVFITDGKMVKIEAVTFLRHNFSLINSVMKIFAIAMLGQKCWDEETLMVIRKREG